MVYIERDMTEAPYFFIEPSAGKVPIVLSIPHRGTEFPEDLKSRFVPRLIESADDADSYLEKLYDFAPALGITVIYAKYSRWVIDLNRTPESVPLYADGRLITELCPTTTFLGEEIYRRKEFEPDTAEIYRRFEKFYLPYHRKIDETLEKLKTRFGQALFWDAHSIRRKVETIRREPFPDFILGDNDGKSASREFSEAALAVLEKSPWRTHHNEPFKGGYLTRSKGNPGANVHALQLEMSKDLYMSENETIYDPEKSEKIKELLKKTFENLIRLL